MALSRTRSSPISMILVVLAVLSLNTVSGKPERHERRVTNDDSTNQRLENSQPPVYSSPNSLSFDSNEFTPEAGKKVTHRLVGGHKKLQTTTVSSRVSDEDEADDDRDEAKWDDGLIISSAGNGKEKNGRTEDDDEKKTLSQQVKEGKYGLIQNELYPSKPKRPGIISYLSNPEVPKDNARNFGGLDEEEIWLAENHVLVLRGGNFPDHEKDHRKSTNDHGDWAPIDNYKAPKRQVKIPPRPKVPPPFPIQLSDNGPVQIIGVNGTTKLGESSDENNEGSYKKGFLPGEGPFFAISENGTIESKNPTGREDVTKTLSGDTDQDGKIKSGHVPPRNSGIIGPFYPSLPPNAVFVVPPSNQSDYDEDDQSIYYPPPYSFYYKQDNSTPVPPGPLVPGIILPPPPDFFSRLEEKKPTTKIQHMKYAKRPAAPTTTPRPRVVPTYFPPRKSSVKPYKSTTASGTDGTVSTPKYTSRGSSFTMKPVNGFKYKTTTGRSVDKPIRVHNTLPFVEITTPSIDKSSTLEISQLYTPRPNTFASPPVEKTTKHSKNRWISNVSSKPVPLVTYYSSSTPSSVDEPIEATPASVNNVITTGKQRGTSNRASYYFYEESNDDVTGTTPNPTVYYHTTTDAPFYGVEELPQQDQANQEKKSYYDVRSTPSQQTPKDYSVQMIEPVSKTSSRYQYTNSVPTTDSVVSSRAKGQRMLTESAPLYYESITERPRTSLRSYYATTKPPSYLREPQDDNRYDYDQGIKPKPIYQYSYEAADYYKLGQPQSYYKPDDRQQSYYKEDTPEATQIPEPFDEWQDIRENNEDQYDYDESETLHERPIQPIEPARENHRYRNRLPITYQTATATPIINTTPNPQHSYYTKQDEQLLDDVTREYFTNFGKKLRGESLPNTTPIYGRSQSVTERPVYTEVGSYVSNDYENERRTETYESPRVKVHYGDQAQRPSYSLEGDTRVNYKNPLPSMEPESEWIPGFNPKQRINLPLQDYQNHQTRIADQAYEQPNLPERRLTPNRNYDGQRIIQQTQGSPTNFVPLGDSGEDPRQNYPTRPISLEGDIAVNYRDPRPPINPDAEFIDSAAIRDNSDKSEKASYFAYRLPGDGGHFYFLTPQAISQRQDENGGYLYPRPRGGRFARQRRRGSRFA